MYFKTEEVPFAIAGMSDEMPYESTVYGQMKKIPLKRDYIKENIQKLDKIFSLHEEQKETIMSVYDIPAEKIEVDKLPELSKVSWETICHIVINEVN